MKANNIIKAIAGITCIFSCATGTWAQEYSMRTNTYKPVKRFAIKLHDAIGLNNAFSLESDVMDLESSSSSNNFGIDLGYTFWQDKSNQFEINLGVGYRTFKINPKVKNLDYHYSAPSTADMDGDTYIRYYEISDMEQKMSTSFFNIPLYLEYRLEVKDWFRVYVDLGAEFMFNTSYSLNSVNGRGFVDGVYPQYGNLKMTDSWLNGFGDVEFNEGLKGDPDVSPLMVSLLAGVGVELKIYDPVWFNIGVRYNQGFSNVFKGKYENMASFNEENAPLTYTVAEGENIKPLPLYSNKGILSLISLNLGLTLRF